MKNAKQLGMFGRVNIAAQLDKDNEEVYINRRILF